jgi:hypothetical protein
MNSILKDPEVVKGVLPMEKLSQLTSSIGSPKGLEFQKSFSRYIASDKSLSILSETADFLTPLARKLFSSETLMPTYTLFAHYEGDSPAPSLYKHKDDNACTYTIDLCLYQTETWDLWVEDKPYTLHPNEALAYYGNDQLHWREEFPNPGNQVVAMIFFHFAEPTHWWFTKGPDYLSVVRNEITKEEYEQRHNLS